MSHLIYYAAIGGFIFNAGRLLDIAWPTKFLPWPFYAVAGSIWCFLMIGFHP